MPKFLNNYIKNLKGPQFNEALCENYIIRFGQLFSNIFIKFIIFIFIYFVIFNIS